MISITHDFIRHTFLEAFLTAGGYFAPLFFAVLLLADFFLAAFFPADFFLVVAGDAGSFVLEKNRFR